MRKGIPGAVEDETSASSTDWKLEIRALFDAGEFWFALPPSVNDVTPVALTFEELSLKILLRAIRLSMVGIDMSSPEKELLIVHFILLLTTNYIQAFSQLCKQKYTMSIVYVHFITTSASSH